MKIAVMGAGGVGGFFGAKLAGGGADVAFIARGEHLDAIRRGGLKVTSPLGDLHIHPARATDDPAAIGAPVDVVMVCVKMWDIESAARAIRPIVGPETLVIPFENGVEAPPRLAAVLGEGPVIGGSAHISALVSRPGVVSHNGTLARIYFGEREGGPSRRGERFLKSCVAAGVDAELSQNIGRVIWEKFVFIAAFSGMTALLRKPIGPIRADPETWAMFLAAMEEAAAVARANGVVFDTDPVGAWLPAIAKMPEDYRASMLEDLERGKRLELPWLSGAVARMARELGVAAPVNAFIAAALKLHADGAGGRSAPPV